VSFDDEAAAKLLPMGATGKCEGWEVGCLIDPGSEGDGEGMLLRSGVLDVWPLSCWTAAAKFGCCCG